MFPKPSEFFVQLSAEQDFNYRLFWTAVSHNNVSPAGYELELRKADDLWQQVSCKVETDNGYLSAALMLTRQQMAITAWCNIGYQLVTPWGIVAIMPGVK